MADFANGGRIDPRATFTRASTANVWDGSKHLSSENLLLQSGNFDTTWTLTGINGTPTGGQADPAGGTDGFTVVESSGGTYHRLHQTISLTGDLALTVYAKQNSGTRYLNLMLFHTSPSTKNFESAVFDLAGGAAATLSGASSTFTSVSTSQTASGGGYYKCVLRATGTISNANISLHNSTTTTGLSTTNGLPSYTGDGTSSIDIAFASLSTTGATDYNPTTTQIHREYAPSLVSKSNNVSRFDHTTDGQSMGILIEGSATNLIPNSSAINSWATVGDVTITDSAAVGPDGTLSASLVRPTTVNSYLHYVRETITTVASSSYTFSAYVKPAGYTKVQLFFYQTSSPYTSGADTSFTLTGSGSATTAVGSSTITAVGGGYYRISVTGVAGTTSTFAAIRILDDSGSNEFVGDGYSGIICTGVQFELGSHPSSLISTSGSAVTRAAESLSVATADIGYTGGPVTLLADTTTLKDTGTLNPVSIIVYRNGDHFITLNANSSNSRAAYVEADNSYSLLTSPASGNGVRALRVDTNDIATALNGTIDVTDTSQTLPDLTGATVYLGTSNTGGNSIDGHIKRVAIYSAALSDSNLISLTK